MNSLEATLRRIARELDARQRLWALVGGLAVSTRAEPRTTRDVDVVVDVTDDDDASNQRLLAPPTPSRSSRAYASPSLVLTIEARGYHRERKLADSLETFFREEQGEKA